MEKIFFTSDTHFGSKRTLQLSKRPFKTVEEMDNSIINNWNNIINKDDIIYHLGDFGNYDIVKQLNGKIILIIGNYEEKDIQNIYKRKDDFKAVMKNRGFHNVEFPIFSKWFSVQDEVYKSKYINLYMVHEPLHIKDQLIYDNSFNLFGHIHEKQMVKKYGLNVGIDSHNFYPIDLSTILFYKNAIENFYDNNVFE